MNMRHRFVALGAATLVLLSGCAFAGPPTDYVGRWDSTSSDAWIEISADDTYEAHDFPAGLADGPDCIRDNVRREDVSGEIDRSTLDAGFLYIDGGGSQWWVDRSLTGVASLRVTICFEKLYESFELSS